MHRSPLLRDSCQVALSIALSLLQSKLNSGIDLIKVPWEKTDSQGCMFAITKGTFQGPQADFCTSGLFYKIWARQFPLLEPNAKLIPNLQREEASWPTTTMWQPWPWHLLCVLPCLQLFAGAIPSDSFLFSARQVLLLCPISQGKKWKLKEVKRFAGI